VSSGRASSAAARIDRCAERLLSRSSTTGGTRQQARRYAVDTYCAPFEQSGWIYEDGALSIDAQNWLDNGGTCTAASSTAPIRTVPCEEIDAAVQIIDCALLHHIRRAQVIAYVTERRRDGDVHCDDGTPLGELGVP
jgi:hypothetical protein